MHTAHLIGVYTLRDMPEELTGFVNFQAKLEKHELRMDERIALLVIVGTSSYVPVFVETVSDLTAVQKRLLDQDAEMDNVTRESLKRVLAEIRERSGA
ncbi:MAG TPA: DUF749 family protein [Methanomassiliicoccales archaeon]